MAKTPKGVKIIDRGGKQIVKGNCPSCGTKVTGMSVEHFNNHYERCTE